MVIFERKTRVKPSHGNIVTAIFIQKRIINDIKEKLVQKIKRLDKLI
jgi:hypothetical protein